MGKKNQEHILDKETGTHDPEESGTGDAGACLTRHVTAYDDKTACGHRWQAYRKAEEYSHWYNYPAYKSLADVEDYKSLKTYTARKNKRRNRLRYPPTPGAWDLSANTLSYEVGDKINGSNNRSPGRFRPYPNFRESATIPYYHNAHHIIPNSVLNGCLLEASKTDMRLFWLVRVGLLKAKYNINHKDNMILLPMGKLVANALGLPRHITAIESEPGVEKQFADHPVYSRNVKKQVKKIISMYANQIQLKEHDVDLPEFTKMKLVRISETLFMRLRVWGKTAKGKAVDSISQDFFNVPGK